MTLWDICCNSSILPWNKKLFLHFQIVQKTIWGMDLQVTFCTLHHSNESFMDECLIKQKPKTFDMFLHTWEVRLHWRKICSLFSASALQIEQMPGPCHFLYCRFSHMRFLLWYTNQEKIMILLGAPVFHKEDGNWRPVWGDCSLEIVKYVSATWELSVLLRPKGVGLEEYTPNSLKFSFSVCWKLTLSHCYRLESRL